eukprot:Partr_v1_DN27635_c0_g1_i1_m65338 putative Protein of unknown function (DUF2009)
MDKTDGRKDLADVLDGKHDNTASSPTGMDVSADASSDEEIAGKLADNSLSTSTSKDFCIECEDQPSSIFCQQCADDYCDVCFQAMHRKGKRRSHMAKRIGPQQVKSATVRKKTSGYGLKAFASARKRLSGVTSSGDDEKSGEDESVEPEFQDAAML